MAITAIASSSIVNASTSPNIDTTGANFIVAIVANFAGNSSQSFTDNKGNTWNSAVDANGNNAYCGIRYSINPTVGTGHNFTTNNGGGFAGIAYIRAYSGVDTTSPFDVGTGSPTNGTTGSSGSITPATNSSLCITGFSANSNYSSGPTAGFTDRGHNNANLLAQMGGGIGDLIQGTASAVNPGYTVVSNQITVVVAAFKPISNTTTNQTYTGKARITATTTQTYTGKSRIQGNATQTYTGKARITGIGTGTYTGLARITANTLKTYTGKARVTNTTTQTYTGLARIILEHQQTYTGKARIQVSSTQTYTGLSRITATTTRTYTGLARIEALGTRQTYTGKARITVTTIRTYTGKAHIIFPFGPIASIVFIVVPENRTMLVPNDIATFIVVPETRTFLV